MTIVALYFSCDVDSQCKFDYIKKRSNENRIMQKPME